MLRKREREFEKRAGDEGDIKQEKSETKKSRREEEDTSGVEQT